MKTLAWVINPVMITCVDLIENVNFFMQLAKHFETHDYKTHAMTAYQCCCTICLEILFEAKKGRLTQKSEEDDYEDIVLKQVFETWTNAAFGYIIQLIELGRLIDLIFFPVCKSNFVTEGGL